MCVWSVSVFALSKTHRGLPSLDKERVIHKYMSEEDMSWISHLHSLTYSKKDFQSPKRVARFISQVPVLDQPWAFNTFSSPHAWRGTRKGIKHTEDPEGPFTLNVKQKSAKLHVHIKSKINIGRAEWKAHFLQYNRWCCSLFIWPAIQLSQRRRRI